MSLRREAAGVVAGTVVTVVLGFLTLLVLPALGFVTASVVGNWLPTWVFAVPLTLCAVVGGATTGYLQETGQRRGAILGGFAAALGVVLVSVVVGFIALVLVLGMTPTHGQDVDFFGAMRTVGVLSGGTGFVVGTIFGALGGVGGHIGRQRRGS
ncbi:hypothetical protein C2R22_02050 [Salinigranum rubrum]|uniref:Uncharacterized protein n=2 Tax=Salinigranum rubrum TaxID=755307 RepID=A0A2I8VF86_9EURY|nr:hypothetical protein C2R22_02050 [Salinigranum rubrum]